MGHCLPSQHGSALLGRLALSPICAIISPFLLSLWPWRLELLGMATSVLALTTQMVAGSLAASQGNQTTILFYDFDNESASWHDGHQFSLTVRFASTTT